MLFDDMLGPGRVARNPESGGRGLQDIFYILDQERQGKVTMREFFSAPRQLPLRAEVLKD